MKKIIALLLCLLMIVGMVACATNTDNNDQTDGSQDPRHGELRFLR